MSDYNPSPIGNPSVLARRNWLQTKLVILIGKLTPRCNQVVRILSKGMDEKLPVKTKIQLQFHYLICSWCQRYAEQLQVIRDVTRKLPEISPDDPGITLSEIAKERMKKALRDK